MKAVVINLDAATERWQFQKWQLAHLGLDYERQAAVSKSEIPEHRTGYWTAWERPLGLTERAAFLSHRKVWQRVVDAAQPMLILEDDAVLSKNVPQLIKTYQSVAGVEHISLEVRSRRKLVSRKASRLADGVALRQLFQDRTGAAAYILTPGGAKKLLAATRKKGGLADAVICAAYNVLSYQCDPACAMQIDQCEAYGIPIPIKTTSAIGNGRQKNSLDQTRGVFNGFGFKIRRALAQVRMKVRALAKKNQGEFMFISANTPDYAHLDIWLRN